jgi:DNA-binding FrmR family transcriptional regulator
VEKKDKDNVLTRLKKIEGQVRGLQKMVHDETDCEKVLQQIAAARAALRNVGIVYITNNFENCLETNLEEKTGLTEEMRSHLREMIKKFTLLT